MAIELHTKLLKTKELEIKEQREQAVPYTVDEGTYDPKNPLDRVTVIIRVGGTQAGWMKYYISTSEGCLHIDQMHNTSSFKHVGTAFFEYAFRKSIEVGMKGRVEVDAIEKAPGAYFNMGFRRKNDLIPPGRLINNYLSSQTSENQELIQRNPSYPYLVRQAAANLKKDEKEITVRDAIHHGISDDEKNSEFAKLLDSRKDFKKLLDVYSSSPSLDLKEKITSHPRYAKLIAQAAEKLSTEREGIPFETAIKHGRDDIEKADEMDCLQLRMDGYMYLPDATIAQKKIEFGITAPIASSQAVVEEVKASTVAAPSPRGKVPNPPEGVTDFFTRPVQQKSSPTFEEPAASIRYDCINPPNQH